MAKAKTITRTIKTTTIKALYADTDTNKMTMEAVVCPGTFKGEDKALKFLKDRATETHIPVRIESMEVNSTLYAISEEDFLKNAHAVVKAND